MNKKFCGNCSKELKGKYKKYKKFCDSSCSATFNNKKRILSEETKLKIGSSLKETVSNWTEKDRTRISKLRSEVNNRPERKKKVDETWLKKLFERPFDEMPWSSKRKRIICEQEFCCNRCGLDKWQGERMTFEVDHKSGDRKDNTRENLEALCPNCHSLTPTWRGRRNKGTGGRGRISDKQMEEALSKYKTIHQALIELGIAVSGATYARAKRIKENASLAQLD